MTDPEYLAEIDRTIGVYEAFSGHAAARTRQMIDRHGAVEALARLMASADLQQGFKVLRDHGKLDDSFEALVVRFAHLFRFDAVEAAKWRRVHAGRRCWHFRFPVGARFGKSVTLLELAGRLGGTHSRPVSV